MEATYEVSGGEVRATSTAIGIIRRFIAAFSALANYQLITKALQLVLIFPVFWALTTVLLGSAGHVTLNNSNVAAFLLTWQGTLWGLLVCVVICATLMMEIGGLMLISAVKLRGGGNPSYVSIIKALLRSIPTFFGPGVLIVVLFTVIVLPLVGSELNVSFLAGLRIPNFITSVIVSNPLYNALYIVAMLALYVCSILGTFFFHFMLLGGLKAGRAYRESAGLVRRHFWRFLGFVIANALIIILILGAIIAIEIVLAALATVFLADSPAWMDTVLLSSTFLTTLLFAAAAYVATPFFVFAMTDRYYTYLREDAVTVREKSADLASRVPVIPEKTRPSLLDRLARLRALGIVGAVVSIIAAAAVIAHNADEFILDNHIPVVAHRGGPGTQYIENTLEAIEDSIRQKAEYVEVDVQRTADGHYIVNHDDTFARFAGESRSSQDMTLAEIKNLQLSVQPNLGPARVPSVEELFDVAQGRIGIFLELKGVTADRQMVDDMVALIKARGMTDQVIIMSLSYELIEYVETAYPEMLSGFTYFLSLGDSTALLGDYVIVEEDALTRSALDEFHAAGKRVAVWTLNEPDSMRKFVHWPIDGAITDYVGAWNQVVAEREAMPPTELIWRSLVE